MVGLFKGQILNTLPAWTVDDEGREIYVQDEQKRYYSDATSWIDYITVGTNEYYVDYSETDQGVIGNGKTIKAYVDAIGSDNAIIYVRNNSGNATTTYTLTTSEIIPSNIIIKIENGAILDGVGTLTIEGIFKADPYQTFGTSITVVFNNPSQVIYPELWGGLPDGSTLCHAAFQAAIISLAANGGIIQLSVGTYMINDGLAFDASNLAMLGMGFNTVIKLADGSDISDPMFNNASVSGYAEVKNIRYENFTVDGNRSNQSSGNIGIVLKAEHSLIKDVHVKNAYIQGVVAMAGWRNELRRVISTNSGNDGIITSLEHDTLLIGCQSYDHSAGNGILAYDASYNIDIQSCFTYNNMMCGIGVEYAVFNGSNHGISIMNCVASSNGWSGITAYRSRHVNITGCTVLLNDNHGILIDGARDCTITSNTIRDNSQDTHNTYNGVELKGYASWEVTGCVVMGNIIKPETATYEKYGIHETAEGYVNDNVIVGNHIGSMGTAPLKLLGDKTKVSKSNNGIEDIDEHNILMNQDFSIWQEAITYTNPATSTPVCDGYYIKTSADGTSLPQIDIKKNTLVKETGYAQSCELDVTNVGSNFTYWRFNQKVSDYTKYAGKTLVASIRIKADVAISATGISLGLFDGVTYQTIDLGTIGTSWTTHFIVLPISSSVSQLRIILALTGTISATNTIYVQWMKLEQGYVPTPIIPIQTRDMLFECQKNYQKSYDPDTLPGTNTTAGMVYKRSDGYASSNHTIYDTFTNHRSMNGVPILQVYSQSGVAGSVDMMAGVVAITGQIAVGTNGGGIYATNGVVNTSRLIGYHWIMDSRLT